MKTEETKLLNEREVAAMLQLAPQTLRKARSLGIGIPYIKFVKSVRYDPQDVLDYLDQCRRKVRREVTNETESK